MSEMEDIVGKRVVVDSFTGAKFEGVIGKLDPDLSKLTLFEAVEVNTRANYTSPLTFSGQEVRNVKVLEDVDPPKIKVGKIKAGAKLVTKKCFPSHLRQHAGISVNELLLKESANENNSPRQWRRTPSAEFSAHLRKVHSNGVTKSTDSTQYQNEVVDAVDQKFHDCIETISKEAMIGLALEGLGIGRKGTLSWISIATEKNVVLFDFQKLGQGTFDSGLRGILESEQILKVVHDCRSMSDMLFNKFNVKLTRVFDTQVMDAFLYRLRHDGDWPRHVQGLGSCLVRYLGLPMDDIHVMVFREHLRREDQTVWLERPASPKVLQAAAKHVVHLLTLRAVLLESYLWKYNMAVEMALCSIREANNDGADRLNASSHLLPSAFQDLENLKPPFQVERCNFDRDENGYQNNVVQVVLPGVQLCRDSIWHKKKDQGEAPWQGQTARDNTNSRGTSRGRGGGRGGRGGRGGCGCDGGRGGDCGGDQNDCGQSFPTGYRSNGEFSSNFRKGDSSTGNFRNGRDDREVGNRNESANCKMNKGGSVSDVDHCGNSGGKFRYRRSSGDCRCANESAENFNHVQESSDSLRFGGECWDSASCKSESGQAELGQDPSCMTLPTTPVQSTLGSGIHHNPRSCSLWTQSKDTHAVPRSAAWSQDGREEEGEVCNGFPDETDYPAHLSGSKLLAHLLKKNKYQSMELDTSPKMIPAGQSIGEQPKKKQGVGPQGKRNGRGGQTRQGGQGAFYARKRGGQNGGHHAEDRTRARSVSGTPTVTEDKQSEPIPFSNFLNLITQGAAQNK